jgi:uncharacterized protein
MGNSCDGKITMKFTRELSPDINVVRSYSDGQVRIGERVLSASCLFNAHELIADWAPRNIEELTADHFVSAFAWQPEIILLGTGARQVFPARAIYAALLSRGIGFEVMDTGAACRTFNVLAGENRRVTAGLIIASSP